MKTLFILCLLVVVALCRQPCGRCVGYLAPCGANGNSDQCAAPYKCVAWQGTQMCLETIKRGEACPEDKFPYDPCPYQYQCDNAEKKCLASGRFASLNDWCEDDTNCKTGLDCVNSLCSRQTGDCTSSDHCPGHQSCQNSTCVDLPGVGSPCLSGSCFNGVCRDGTCIAAQSIAAGGGCDSTFECVAGLVCDSNPDYDLIEILLNNSAPVDPRICQEENLDRAPKYGVSWSECTSKSYAGCQCNYDAHVLQSFVQVSRALPPNCRDVVVNFGNCMKRNNCPNIEFGQNGLELNEGACLRKFCYGNTRQILNCLGAHSSLVPPVCSAHTFGILLILGLLFILL